MKSKDEQGQAKDQSGMTSGRPAALTKVSQVLISIFIIAYFVLITVCVMGDCPLKDFLHRYTKTTEILLSLDQSWKMFCPNPRGFYLHSFAVITFKDGTTAYYEFPRMEKMSQWDAFLRERLRKHYCDILPWDDYKMLRPSVARYLARCFFDPSNPPVQVSLGYNCADIPAMPNLIPRLPLPRENIPKNFYVYKIMPGDLQ